MKALISPNENAVYISGWNPPVEPSKMYTPIFTVCGKRVCQVQEDEFPVALPLFWIDCADNVTAETYCYDATNQTIIAIPPNEPDPNPFIPVSLTKGTQQA